MAVFERYVYIYLHIYIYKYIYTHSHLITNHDSYVVFFHVNQQICGVNRNRRGVTVFLVLPDHEAVVSQRCNTILSVSNIWHETSLRVGHNNRNTPTGSDMFPAVL